MTTFTPDTLPIVHPMAVRAFRFKTAIPFRDKWVATEFEVGEPEMADSRLPFDDDMVDISNAMLDFTTHFRPAEEHCPVSIAIFTSRRWRSHRTGDECQWLKDGESLLFLGNPVRVHFATHTKLTIYRQPDYLIMSGAQMGY